LTVAILIVNWNAGSLLGRCLQSVQDQRRAPDHVIVVDNASTDDSLEQAALWLRGVQLIKLSENTGFAHANNVAARAALRFDAIALLNPDAIADRGWLDALTAAAQANPEIAAFGSRMLMASAPLYLDGTGDSYHVSGRAWRKGHGTLSSRWPAGDAEIFGPCAAAALYRRAAFDEVGGFDERFFCYFEDVDLAFRLRLRGYRCRYVHAALVHHFGSAATTYRSHFAVYHGERNAVWTFLKNMPAPLVWMYLPQHLALNAAALLFYPWRGQGRTVIAAKVDALRQLPAVLRQRTDVQHARRVSPWKLRRCFARGLLAPYVRRYR
jgi:GT2 family glycosyltransferase